MRILTIETTGRTASVALIDGDGRLTEKRSPDEMNHLVGLPAQIDALLTARGLSLRDVTHIAVSEGPGSFTGVRIGVTVARAFAQVRNLPVIGVPTLASFVFNLSDFGGIVCPLFDARRAQVYGGVFDIGEDGMPRALARGAAWSPDELLDTLDAVLHSAAGAGRECVLFGDGLDVYGERVLAWCERRGDGRVRIADRAVRAQNAASVARLALRMAETGGQKPYAEVKPVYMREAEAQRKLDERMERERTGA